MWNEMLGCIYAHLLLNVGMNVRQIILHFVSFVTVFDSILSISFLFPCKLILTLEYTDKKNSYIHMYVDFLWIHNRFWTLLFWHSTFSMGTNIITLFDKSIEQVLSRMEISNNLSQKNIYCTLHCTLYWRNFWLNIQIHFIFKCSCSFSIGKSC